MLQAMLAVQLASAELQQQQAAAALDICIQHHLAAEDITRLWCSSRSLQQLCSARLSSAVLVRSVAAAAAGLEAAPAAAEDRSMVSLQWLLRQPELTAMTVNQCRQQLLGIRCVPSAAAEALVAAGLRMQITGQQLVEAAYSCVEGLDVWVAAFDSAAVPQQEWAADLPLGMRHMCCGRQVPQQVCVQLVFTNAAVAPVLCSSVYGSMVERLCSPVLPFQEGIITAVLMSARALVAALAALDHAHEAGLTQRKACATNGVVCCRYELHLV
jgi:hypothetical protein